MSYASTGEAADHVAGELARMELQQPNFADGGVQRGCKVVQIHTQPTMMGRQHYIFAARNGHKAVAEVLLDHGAEAKAVDNNGLTAIYLGA